MGKPELVQSLCCKELPETTQMFVMDEYVREITMKKACMPSEYGSFEHLLLENGKQVGNIAIFTDPLSTLQALS